MGRHEDLGDVGPTNNDLWGEDPHYDPELTDRPRRRAAVWAVFLSVTIAVLVSGGLAWMLGKGAADASSARIVHRTALVTMTPEDTPTATKTVMISGAARTAHATATATAYQSRYVTLPPVIKTVMAYKDRTVTIPPRAAPTVTVHAEPTVTETVTREDIRCYAVNPRTLRVRGEIPCP